MTLSRILLSGGAALAMLGTSACVTDPNTGERACAVIVMNPGADALSLSDVVDFLRERELIAQKLPEQLECVDQLPRNATGKVLKHDLRELFISDEK